MNLPVSKTTLYWFLAAIIAFSCAALWLIGRMWTEHGLLRTDSAASGYAHSGLWLWPAIGGDDFSTEDGIAEVSKLNFEGYVWQGAAGETTWQIVHNGQIKIWIDNSLVFEDTEAHQVQTDTITVHWEQEGFHLKVEDYEDITTSRTKYPYRTEMGIYEQGILGTWHLIPAYRLYPSKADSATTQKAFYLNSLNQFFLLLIGLSFIAMGCLFIWQQRLWRSSTAWIILGIMLLTLILRLIVMAERANADPFFYFIVPGGDDNYVLMGKDLLSGQYNLAGTFWPPAPIIWFGAIVTLLGPQLWKIYLANILLSTAAAGAVSAAGWLAFNRRVGIISGLLFALYPPLIFYQATVQSVVLDAAFASFALLFGVMAIKRGSFLWAALFGVAIGLGGLSRGTALLLGLAFFIGLMLNERVKGIKLTVIAALFCILTLMPQISANTIATGKFSPVPYSNGALTLYSGNNRDASGVWAERGMAWELERLEGGDWIGAFISDFRSDPMHMVELNLRKLGMFWNRYEYVSNTNYSQQGLDVSLLLRIFSLNGSINMEVLSFFAWLGMVMILLERRREGCFIVWGIIALVGGTILFVIAGRLRVPVLPFIVVAAAFGLATGWEIISHRRIHKNEIAAFVTAISLALIFPVLDSQLPQKSYVSLSDTAIQRNDNFNNEIRLLGFDPIATDYTPDGYFYISLYWQIIAPTPVDYHVFVELADDSGRLVAYDGQLGTVTYPPLGTTNIPPNRIIKEGYLIRLPHDMPPIVHVNVGLYDENGNLPLIDAKGNQTEQQLVTLFDMGIHTKQEAQSILEDATNANVQFGKNLLLNRYHLSDSPEAVDIQMEWQAKSQIYENFVIFIHLVDENGTSISQIDNPIVQDNRTTSAMIPGEIYLMQRRLPIPADLPAGTYTVLVGIYHFPSLQRLPLVDNTGKHIADNILTLDELQLGQ